MALKPQDVCILLKIVALERAPWSYSQLAYQLGMSASEVHAGVKRAADASLLRLEDAWGTPDPEALEEFLIHGAKYVFAPQRGPLVRGIPTCYAAPPLNRVVEQLAEPPPVWPDDAGDVRGYEFAPLYKSVPFAVRRDAKLYELLALVDTIRSRNAHGYQNALHELKLRLGTASRDADLINLARPGNSAKSAARPASAKARRGNNGQEA